MVTVELENYLKECKEKGIEWGEVEKLLITAGYPVEMTTEAKNWYTPPAVPTIPLTPTFPTISAVVPASTVSPAKITVDRGFPKVLGMLLVVGIVVILAGLGGTGYLVASERITLNNPVLEAGIKKIVFSIPFIPKTPKIVLAMALEAHKKVLKNSWNLSLSAKGLDSQVTDLLGSQTFDLLLSGYSDFSNDKNVKFSLSANVGNDIQVDLRKKDKMLYINVPKIPVAIYPLLGLEPDKVKPLLLNWVAVDMTPLDTEARKSLLEMKPTEQSQTQKTTQQVMEKMLNEEILPLLVMTTEPKDDYDAYKIVFKPTPSQIDRIEAKMKLINSQTSGPIKVPTLPQTDTLVPTLKAPKTSEIVKNPIISIWIDKKTNLVRRMELTLTFDGSSMNSIGTNMFGAAPNSETNSNQKIDIATVLKLDDFGKEVAIVTPDKSLTPEELYQKFAELNPGGLLGAMPRQMGSSNNTRRQADINALLNAIGQYMADNRGKLPAGITTTEKKIAKSGADICQVLVPTYLSMLPVDPKLNEGAPSNCATNYDSGYVISKDAAGRVTISAPMAESGVKITVTR